MIWSKRLVNWLKSISTRTSTSYEHKHYFQISAILLSLLKFLPCSYFYPLGPRPIVKTIYKVIKSFSLDKDADNNHVIVSDLTNVRGSIFAKGDAYVDYVSEHDNEQVSDITRDLESKKFLVLESEHKMQNRA